MMVIEHFCPTFSSAGTTKSKVSPPIPPAPTINIRGIRSAVMPEERFHSISTNFEREGVS